MQSNIRIAVVVLNGLLVGFLIIQVFRLQGQVDAARAQNAELVAQRQRLATSLRDLTQDNAGLNDRISICHATREEEHYRNLRACESDISRAVADGFAAWPLRVSHDAVESIAGTSCMFWQLRARSNPEDTNYAEWSGMCMAAGFNLVRDLEALEGSNDTAATGAREGGSL